MMVNLWLTLTLVVEVLPGTFFLAGIILLASLILGSIGAVIKQKRLALLTPVIDVAISYMRGVPLLVHLLITQAALPRLVAAVSHQSLSEVKIPSIVIVLVCYIAFQTILEIETIRGILTAIDRQQIEAGLTIGMTLPQIYRRLIIPQILPVAIPLVVNSFIKVIRSLSVAFLVGVIDIMASVRYAAALSSSYILSYFVAALVYWGICVGIEVVVYQLVLRKSLVWSK